MSKEFIVDAGYHHPPERVTNAQLAKRVETSDAWILERTGIAERRRAAADVLTSDMGVLATYAAGVEQHAETLRDGDWILMTMVGAGCTGGSVLLRWTRRD